MKSSLSLNRTGYIYISSALMFILMNETLNRLGYISRLKNRYNCWSFISKRKIRHFMTHKNNWYERVHIVLHECLYHTIRNCECFLRCVVCVSSSYLTRDRMEIETSWWNYVFSIGRCSCVPYMIMKRKIRHHLWHIKNT